MEVQCCIARRSPGCAARASAWRMGGGRRVPERTTNPSAVIPPRWEGLASAKTEQLAA